MWQPIAGALAIARAGLAVPVGYLSLLTGAASLATLRARGRTVEPAPRSRVAVLIPAHDEEQVIGDTLRAMAAVDHGDFAVHVVADHCTDSTVAIAEAAGVDVLDHEGPTRGKGAALQWAIRRLLVAPSPPDVFVIVDADTIVAPMFLREVETALADGGQAVQGQYRVRDPGSSTGAGLRAVALALRHHVRPLGRTSLGASCGLYGNGMAFTADVLASRRWTSHLTEDVEFQMELLLDGVLVRYAPAAVVEALMPPTLESAQTQNERWERGRVDLAKRYVPQLLRLAVGPTRDRSASRIPRVAALDGALDHLVPPLSVLATATGGVAVASSAVTLLRGSGRHWPGWLLVAALGGHVASGLALAKLPASVYRSLLHAPAMVVWKVRLWLRALRPADDVEWVRTARSVDLVPQ